MEFAEDRAAAKLLGALAKAGVQKAIPWEVVLAVLSALFASCPTPAAANIRAQAKRPVMRLRIISLLVRCRVPTPLVVNLTDVVIRELLALSDEDLEALATAAKIDE